MANEFRVKNGLIVDEISSGAGTVTIAEGDISSDATMSIISTGNATNSIYIRENAGTDGTIKIHADQGTGADSITVLSDAGGIDVDAAGAISVESSAGSITIGSSVADGEGVILGKSGAAEIQLKPHGTASSESITVTNTAGTAADAIDIEAVAGGITLDAGTDITLDADGADIYFKDGGTTTHHFFNGSSIAKLEFGYNTEISPTDTAHGTAGRTLELAGGDTTAGTSNDIAGGNIVIRGGYGKGNADGGNVTLSVASTNGASSGSSLNNTRDAFISISGSNGAITMNDSLAGISMQSAGLTVAPKTGVTGQDSVVDLTLGDNSNSSNDADRRLLYATSEAVYRAALNMDGSGSMSTPIYELGVGGTVTANTSTALPTQAQYTSAATAFAFGSGGAVYRIGDDNASTNEVLTFNGTKWVASAASSGGASLANDANNRITTADGSGGINGEANLTFDGDILTIGTTHTTDDAVDINANSITTGSVMDISATGLTDGAVIKTASTSTVTDGGTSKAFDLAITNDGVGSQTAYGMAIDYNKSGITASGKTSNVYGIMVDIDDSATNVGSATIYGGAFSAVAADAGGTMTTVGLYADASGGDNNYAAIFPSGNVGVGTNSPDHLLEVASSSASQPVLAITNTHAGTTSGELRFNKNSASGGDNDVMGMISFYGTDDSDNTHERLAYMDAIITDSAHGSEAASLRFYVAENDATLTQGLLIAGQADNDGEVDVTIGAGSGSTTTIAGHLTITGDMNITGDVNSVSVTDLDVDDLTITVASGAGSSANADGAGIIVDGAGAQILYDHTGTQWEINKPIEITGGLFPAADDTYDLGSASLAWQDLYLEGDITFSDAGSITTSAGGLTITPAAASTWSTGAGALTLTSAAAATWSTGSGVLTLSGDDGIQITSAAAGNIDLDSYADIVLDVADNKHVIVQKAGTSMFNIGVGTEAKGDGTTAIAEGDGATAIDVFDCAVYQATKYFIIVEDTVNDDFMTTEILLLGDDYPSDAEPFMTVYAVVFNNVELGTFTATGETSGTEITLNFVPANVSGTGSFKVRAVAQRISSI